MQGPIDVLQSIRAKGARLWSENRRLHYRAPKGALTNEDLERLRIYKDQLVSLLDESKGADAVKRGREPAFMNDVAPLTFSQLAHWHFYRLSDRRSIRQVASALRLQGRLNKEALRRSVAEVVRRHEALRTRIVVRNGELVQEISESTHYKLESADLTTSPMIAREAELNRRIEAFILEPINVAEDSLFGALLLSLQKDEHVLVVAMEHMISDGFSLNIVWQDLFAIYVQVVKGLDLSLPPIPLQFAEYAILQSKAHRSWLEKHGPYWAHRGRVWQRLRFVDDESPYASSSTLWGAVPLKIPADLKSELREWARLNRTTLVMTVFTVYVALVLRSCHLREAVFQYQSDGRDNKKIERTVGYFASMLYIHVKLLDEDSFVDLVDRVTIEYCRAYEHADSSYLAGQACPPGFTKNPAFNWLPQGSLKIDFPELDGSEDAMSCSPVRFVYPTAPDLEIDSEPSVLLSDAGDEIVGDVYFPVSALSTETMQKFVRNFMAFVTSLLRQPDKRVTDILLK